MVHLADHSTRRRTDRCSGRSRGQSIGRRSNQNEFVEVQPLEHLYREHLYRERVAITAPSPDALGDRAAIAPRKSTSSRLVRVAITGSALPLGRRVIERLSVDGAGFSVCDLSAVDSGVDEIDVIVHLSPGDHDALVARATSAVAGTPELLALADAHSAHHIVLLSSALVYGAWPNNPVPLTEEAALRPDFGFAFARQLATVEQLVDDWSARRPDRSVTVLRPVPAMAHDGTSGLVRALAAGMGGRMGEEEVPAQFVHLDDLADAVVLAVNRRLDGIYNVAPDGHVPGSRVRSLSGMVPKVRLPGRLAEIVADLQWRFQRGPIPPGLRPYVRSPWLVSNDRLRAEGWNPTVTNEQAFVEGTDAKWWTMLTPKRKQELALGAAALVSFVAIASVTSWLRRRRLH
jgi:nucleoside-diphosphate-sugar epimerase